MHPPVQTPPKIATSEQLSKCVELLEVIGNIGITAKIIEKEQSVDDIYDSLQTTIELVTKNSNGEPDS